MDPQRDGDGKWGDEGRILLNSKKEPVIVVINITNMGSTLNEWD